MSAKHPEAFTVKAWGANAIAFIAEQGQTREFSDWCGGWPCPVSPEMIAAVPELLEALELFQAFGCPRCNGDCGSANPPVTACPIQAAQTAIAKARGEA